MRIKDLAAHERPREKAWLYGIEQLDDAELLAVIIGTGIKKRSALEIANDILKDHHGLKGLALAHHATLADAVGLSRIGALKLAACFQLAERLKTIEKNEVSIIRAPRDLHERYRYLESYDQEVLIIVLLSGNGTIMRERLLYKGTADDLSISLREIIVELLLGKARKFALIHNHPGGLLQPSDADLASTELIARRAREFDIAFYDHLIIFDGGYYSFREHEEG